jgi:tetratricopeptide (TPR) repeat protein
MENPGYEYIDSYFKGVFTPEETSRFEKKIEEDPAFAAEVAFYLSALQVARDEQALEKKRRFREIYQSGNTAKSPGTVKKLWAYIGVAALVAGIIFGLYIFTKPESQRQLADRYIGQHLQTLGVTMSSREDSMQTGLKLYNEGRHREALQQFETIIQSDTANFTAKKYAGLVSLRLQEYDKALLYFRQLETYTGLYANPSLFYQALTLMERNRTNDAAEAKQLLKQVVQNDLEGKEIAQEWMKKW